MAVANTLKNMKVLDSVLACYFSMCYEGAQKGMDMNPGSKKCVVVACVLFALSFSTAAQLNLGRIFGGITDESGGAIVGATVTVLDVQRGVTRPLVTDAAGQY